MRPFPPDRLLRAEDSIFGMFLPAPDVEAWVRAEILEAGGRLHNDDHQHLLEARVGFLWTNEPYAKQMTRVVGQAEQPVFRGGAWQKARQEQQLREWFGEIPDFVITLDAVFAAGADDATWCAVVEHELYHCAQARDEFGAPAFRKDGRPKLAIRGHDVEEFVGVVKRYGAGHAAGATAQLVEAARRPPAIGLASIAGACGTCLLKAA